MKPAEPCLAPLCTGVAVVRGVCFNHYQSCRRMVRAGKTTWAELEEVKMCVKPAQAGPPCSMMVELERRRKARGGES